MGTIIDNYDNCFVSKIFTLSQCKVNESIDQSLFAATVKCPADCSNYTIYRGKTKNRNSIIGERQKYVKMPTHMFNILYNRVNMTIFEKHEKKTRNY